MTDSNLFQEIQEDLERQKLEALWKRYGVLVLAAAIAIVAATAGYTAWTSYNQKQHEQTTTAYLEAAKIEDSAKKIESLQGFADKNSATVQASFARIQQAALLLKDGKTDEAIKIYQAIANDASTDPAFRQLASLYEIRAQLDSAEPAELQKNLEPLMADKAPFRFTAMEYAGYVALRAGDKAKARQIFTDLSQNASAPHTIGARAADMLRYVSE